MKIHFLKQYMPYTFPIHSVPTLKENAYFINVQAKKKVTAICEIHQDKQRDSLLASKLTVAKCKEQHWI